MKKVLKKIACLGWGSLVWDHRTLPVVGEWMNDGPLLPIEFARESQDGRITLVLCDDVPLVQTCWALVSVEDVSAAIDALAVREGIKLAYIRNIGWWNSVDGKSNGRCANEIEAWAKSQWLDGVVWTNLPCGLKGSPGVMPTSADVVEHVAHLEGEALARAKQYVNSAPAQIDTAYRRAMTQSWG
jgi:hypothetical protein